MYTRFGMGAFLENPMFLFMDDAEPILPIIRSPEYGDSGRIVELTDVGCDTEPTFPVRLPYFHGAFDRRRGGAESFESARRIAKWRNETPRNFSRAVAVPNNNEGRNENYVGGNARRNDRNYDNVYIADLDYDSFAENPYDDFEFTKDNTTTKYRDGYYTRYISPPNVIGHSRKERLPRNTRYEYSRDRESPFTRSISARQRANISPRWFADSDERNIREMRGTDVQSSGRKKRAKTFSRMDERTDLDRETEFGKAHGTRYRERDDFSNTFDPIALSKSDFWEFVSLENEANREDVDVDVVDSEREEEFKATRQRNSRENLSSKTRTGSAKYRISKSDAVTEKPKILRSNASNANSSRICSARIPIDDRISHTAEKSSIRPRSAIGGKETSVNSPTTERKEAMISAIKINADNRLYREKFVNKLSNTSPSEMNRLARISKRVARSNERIYATSEKDNTNSHPRNPGNSKIDRTNAAVSRSAPEEEVTKNERTFALRLTDVLPRTEVEKKEKKRKFSSRLPLRTWKRLRTKEPAALRLENDITNGDVGQKLQGVNIETTISNNYTNRIEDDKVYEEIVEDRATADRSDIKHNNRSGTGSFNVDKTKSAPSNLKNIKGVKGLNIAKGTEQRKKRINVK